MAMDVIGWKPDSKVGEYFCRNIWNWQVIWGYCASVSVEAANLGDSAYCNDGAGLDAKDAKNLAATLRQQLATGATKAEVKRIDELEVAPPVPPATEALITFLKKHGREALDLSERDVSNFNAAGPTRCLFDEHDVVEFAFPPRHFDEHDVLEFALFLEHSGGFAIY